MPDIYDIYEAAVRTDLFGELVWNVGFLWRLNKLPAEELVAKHNMQNEWLESATLVDIGLPHDGEQFVDDTPSECADRLLMLRGLGYNVPQFAIDALRQEASDE